MSFEFILPFLRPIEPFFARNTNGSRTSTGYAGGGMKAVIRNTFRRFIFSRMGPRAAQARSIRQFSCRETRTIPSRLDSMGAK